ELCNRAPGGRRPANVFKIKNREKFSQKILPLLLKESEFSAGLVETLFRYTRISKLYCYDILSISWSLLCGEEFMI
ncbi:hypothetical protein, partial [Acetobacter malorum]|uniref:hypothetical protein n=1 Tax=Acetobacter malorum TaxID=178901 RepID=UPI001E41A2DD